MEYPGASQGQNEFKLGLIPSPLLARSFQRLDIRNQRGNLRRPKFSAERRHLTRFTLADPAGDPVVGKTQIVQAGAIVTVGGGTMTMRAVS
jgi:hypothetical protein